jgi:hypothetical protein
MEGWLIFIGIIIVIAFFGWLFEIRSKAKKYDELKPRLDKLDNYKHELEVKNAELVKRQTEWEKKVEFEKAEWEKKVEFDRRTIEILAKEKSSGFPWLANAFADFYYLQKLKEADYLEHKSHPAPVSAEKVRNITRERRIIEEKLRITQGIIHYYQNLFPFLEEFLGEIDEEVLKKVLSRNIEEPIKEVDEVGIDPVRIYLSSLSEEEYQKLSSAERNQLALDRYWSRPYKSWWQIGKEYERYVGYIYEANGYNVFYQGILEGFDDLGRDLICKKEEQTIIIQCKRWSQHKTIHEKHINQLYGTVIKYIIDNKLTKQPSLFPFDEKISAILYTTTKLSDRAKEFAKCLCIGVNEEFPLQKYPLIKCNVSRRNGEKIYHLPFDQQYDRTLIEEEKNECYVETVKEAESLGFRRAWRWRGQEPE